MSAGNPAASVVVVTHQSVHSIRRCLASLREHPSEGGQEVIVVDNASTDGTSDLIAKQFPEVRLVVSPRRRGFAANCNSGARLASGRNLLFLNPDAEITPGAIDDLVQVLDTDSAIGIAGPHLLYPDGSEQPSARRFPTPMTTLIRRSPVRWVMRDSSWEKRHLMLDRTGDPVGDGRPVDVDWVLGAAMAIRAAVYRRLGGMDDGYRLYCEDIDLCWRAWQAGLRVVQVPRATIIHDLAEVTRHRFATRATVWHVRGMVRFVSRHGVPRPNATRAARSTRRREPELANQGSDSAGPF